LTAKPTQRGSEPSIATLNDPEAEFAGKPGDALFISAIMGGSGKQAVAR